VIGAFNSDLPFDRFIVEQLAADLVPLDDSKSLAALGFLTVGGHFMTTRTTSSTTHRCRDPRLHGSHGHLCALPRSQFDPIPAADITPL